MKKFSWNDIEEITDEMARVIRATGFVPDYVVGIAFGGLIPLYFLAKKLNIECALTVSASSYEKDKQKGLYITYLPEIDLRGKKILLVDEIVESGDTLKTICDIMLTQYRIGELKTAVLAVNTNKCRWHPDFHAIAVDGEWVVFPWEKSEFPEYFK